MGSRYTSPDPKDGEYSFAVRFCDLCGADDQKLVPFYGDEYCAECISDINATCDRCGRDLPAAEINDQDERFICQMCARKERMIDFKEALRK